MKSPYSNSPSQISNSTSNPRAIAALFKRSLDEMFNSWNASKPLRTGMPHASSILAPDSNFCLRQLVLLAVYPDDATRPETKPWDAHQNAVFLNGWVLHEKYQDLFKKFGKVIEVEEKHYDPVRLLYYTPDAIVEHCGERMIVEIKGYKQSSFERMDESGPAPRDAHMQANFYCHLLNLKHALILVECKDTQDYKVWCVEYDKELAQPYLDRLYHFKVALHKAQHGPELPEKCCKNQSDRQAQKCPMRVKCFGAKV